MVAKVLIAVAKRPVTPFDDFDPKLFCNSEGPHLWFWKISLGSVRFLIHLLSAVDGIFHQD